MATKKFNQMATSKLEALLETANEQDRVKIQEVLDTRKQVTNAAEDDEEPLTAEEQAMLDAAEANGGVNPYYEGKTQKAAKAPKMSNEECEALVVELKETKLHHKCQVVPFNSAEWLDGHVAGVLYDKRSNKVMLQVKLEDGRKVVKVHDSKLIKVFDEVIEIERAACKTREPKERVEWTPEVIAQLSKEARAHIGKPVNIKVDRSEEAVTGRIVGFVAEKRSQSVLMRVEVANPTEEDANATKIVHKVLGSEGLEILDFDEEGQAIQDKYNARRTKAAEREALTPQDRVLKCEANLAKAQEALTKAQAAFDAKQAQLAQAKAELEAYLAKAQEDLA